MFSELSELFEQAAGFGRSGKMTWKCGARASDTRKLKAGLLPSLTRTEMTVSGAAGDCLLCAVFRFPWLSARGHSQRLCKECATLGAEKLAYRQAVRDIQRLLTPEGIIPRKRRKQFEKSLGHENEWGRFYAKGLQSLDAEEE